MKRLLLAATILVGWSAGGQAQTASGTPFLSTLSVAGISSLQGATTIGTTSTAAALAIIGPAGAQRALQFNTGNSRRWQILANSTLENGTPPNNGSDLDFFAMTDAGASPGGAFMRMTRATGYLTLDPSKIYSATAGLSVNGQITNSGAIYQGTTRNLVPGVSMGGSNVNPMGWYQNVTWTGTVDSGAGIPDFNVLLAHDQVKFDRALPMSSVLVINDSFEQGASGDRIDLNVYHGKSAASADGGDTQAFNIWAHMAYDVGESSDPANPKGRAGSVNFDTRIGGTGNAVRSLSVQENDIRLFAGNTVDHKINISLNNGVGDRGHGKITDAAMQFVSSGEIPYGTGGNTILLQLGGAAADWPIDPLLTDSAILRIRATEGGGLLHAWQAITHFGFDLFGGKFVDNVIRSTGWAVDGKGQQSIGPATVSYINGGVKLAVPGFATVSAAVANGGTNYKLGDQIWDAYGGLYNVATITGGSTIGTVTPIAGYTSFPPTANPTAVPVKGGTGINNATLNLTTTATGLLQLSDLGQTLSLLADTVLAPNLPTTAPAAHCALWVSANVVTRTTCP